MGGGSWTRSAFSSYATTSYNCSLDSTGVLNTSSHQDIYKSRSLPEILNPRNVMRECRDSEEHPNTVPVILALDVTGSMGEAATEVAKKLNVIMTDLYDKVTDVEFMIMGIGDLAYDDSPIQISQFESDIRIAEQMDKVYFEWGGGGNNYESYTAAWYMASRHTQLDCWERGKKGIIITIGDERCNPYLPHAELNRATGDSVQSDVETSGLFEETSEKFNIFHIDVEHRNFRDGGIDASWETVIGDNYKKANLNNLTDVIVDIITNNVDTNVSDNFVDQTQRNENGEIVW